MVFEAMASAILKLGKNFKNPNHMKTKPRQTRKIKMLFRPFQSIAVIMKFLIIVNIVNLYDIYTLDLHI